MTKRGSPELIGAFFYRYGGGLILIAFTIPRFYDAVHRGAPGCPRPRVVWRPARGFRWPLDGAGPKRPRKGLGSPSPMPACRHSRCERPHYSQRPVVRARTTRTTVSCQTNSLRGCTIILHTVAVRHGLCTGRVPASARSYSPGRTTIGEPPPAARPRPFQRSKMMSTRRKRAGRFPAIPPPVQPYGQCRLRADTRQVMTRDRNNSAMPKHSMEGAGRIPGSEPVTDQDEAIRRRSPFCTTSPPARRAASSQGFCGGHQH
ncbi:hypothetical protein ACVWZM_005228 [Bradyrhizobium sp. USDA 4501]